MLDEIMNATTRTIFLPGASGSATFWKPVADRTSLDGVFLAWPGLGNEPAHPNVNSINDLVSLVLAHMSEPVNIVAQSMGGLVAMKAAIAAPEKVDRIVLTVTSGGVPISDLGGSDWREAYYQAFPRAAKWIAGPVEDLSNQMRLIVAPTLLIWGDSDPISPVAVGDRLRALLLNATLHVVNGADHDLAQTHADIVANLVEQHLTAAP
jgi:2-hydroxy-6-oxonona-2,4-dienedioate hydrolase